MKANTLPNPLNHLLVTLILLATCACGGVSSPVPQPVPGQFRLSSPGATSSQTLVVGLKGAVSGQGKVHVRDRVSGQTAAADSTAQGTFSMVLPVGDKASLEAWFVNADGQSDAVSLSLRGLSYGPSLGQAVAGVVSAPDSKGQVTVSNDGGAGKPLLMSATPNMVAIITNSRSGGVLLATTDKDGRFSGKLAAAKGDSIRVMLTDPQQQTETSDFRSFTVP